MGKEKSLHRNKHDFVLKLKTCQVCAACCLIMVHREFENPGENNAPRKKCWIREIAEKQWRAQEASHYRCRRRRVSGSRISFEGPGGKTQMRERWCGITSSARTSPPLPSYTPAVQGSFSRIRTRRGCASLRLRMKSLFLPKSRYSRPQDLFQLGSDFIFASQ